MLDTRASELKLTRWAAVVRKALTKSCVQNSLSKHIIICAAKPTHLKPAQAPKWPLNVGHVPWWGRLLKHLNTTNLKFGRPCSDHRNNQSLSTHVVRRFWWPRRWFQPQTHRDKRFSKDILVEIMRDSFLTGTWRIQEVRLDLTTSP